MRSHHAEESTYNRGGGAFEGYGTCVARLETTSKDALHLSSKQGPDFNDREGKKASVNGFFVEHGPSVATNHDESFACVRTAVSLLAQHTSYEGKRNL